MVAIYRTLDREMDESVPGRKEEVNYIDFDHFKKGIIRIVILTKTQSIETEVKNRQKRGKSKMKQKDDTNANSKAKSNKLKELEQQIQKIEKLQKIKVEEKRISKEFDVSLISYEDVEKFFRFLQLDPNDDKYTMDKKLTDKNGYPKTIVFEGLEGSYVETYSRKDSISSNMQK